MKGMLKGPLILAALLVVGRVAAEQSGAPDSINNLISVVVLYVFLAPLYFAFKISGTDEAHPYKTLLKNVVLFAALARAMVIPTYWLAYIYHWPQARFGVSNGGVVGPGVGPLRAFVIVPLLAAAAWILASLVIGGGLGSIVVALRRKTAVKVAA
jgi:hypothetical protein